MLIDPEELKEHTDLERVKLVADRLHREYLTSNYRPTEDYDSSEDWHGWLAVARLVLAEIEEVEKRARDPLRDH